MHKNYDVVIIGGGIQGLSLAYYLARDGSQRVVLFEKSYLGSGASGRNGEMIRSAFGSREWIGLWDKSLQLWENLAAELGFNVMFTRHGYLVLATNPEEFEGCRRNKKTQQEFGLATSIMDAEEVIKLIPAINPDLVAGGVDGHQVKRLFRQALLPLCHLKIVIICLELAVGLHRTDEVKALRLAHVQYLLARIPAIGQDVDLRTGQSLKALDDGLCQLWLGRKGNPRRFAAHLPPIQLPTDRVALTQHDQMASHPRMPQHRSPYAMRVMIIHTGHLLACLLVLFLYHLGVILENVGQALPS